MDHAALATRRILPVSITLLLVLAGLTGFLLVNQRVTVRESRAWVGHSHEVMQTTQRLYAYIAELGSAERGYLLSASPAFLVNYDGSKTGLSSTAAALRNLV